ncbi:hypothetical protein [Kitasatospora sp. NPDC127060]|uniref:hypothetical protein n=1 Tax=Kitasatospora sp. NPDC127060 TaxID=3347121 RepID=UPI00364C56A3
MTGVPIPKALTRLADRFAPKARAAGHTWRRIRSVAAMYWPGRRTVLMTLGMTYLFFVAGTQSAFAADSERGGVLAPLNVLSSEGVPLSNYDLKSDPGGATDIRSHVCNLLIGGGFALVRLVVGLMCWIIQWIWNFPIVKTLTDTADKINYDLYVVASNDLNLYDVFLAGGVAFGALLMMRGKIGRGAGEMAITLLLSGLVVMPMFTPRAILGEQGPLVQAQQAAHEAGQIVTNVNGPDPGCTSDKDKADPSCPMRMMLTRTLVVQPFELLQYGIIPDPNSRNANERAIAEVHRQWIHGEIRGKNSDDCGISWLPGNDAICKDTSAWDELKDRLKSHGAEGKNAYNFAVNSDWDRAAGVGLVLLAVVLVAVVVLGMALVHIGTQFADVIAASVAAPAGVWAMLPGGNRAALWKWLGVFLTSVVTELAVSVMLPMFTLGANGILTDSHDTVMVQRLLILDGFAVVILVFHRRIFSAAGQLGERFANRMRFSKIGGALFMGENTGLGLAMSQAMGNLSGSGGGYSGRGGGIAGGLGMFGGGGATSALMRKARIADGLSALADPGLGPMNAGAMAMGAYGQVRQGLSALAMPVRAAHQLVVGNPLPPHKLARRLKPVGTKGPLGGAQQPQGAHPGAYGPEGKGQGTTAGRHVMMPKSGITPAGHALHNRLLNTRIGRMAILAGKVGKFGWAVTAGAPATWTRINRANDRMWDHVNKQWTHYSNVRKAWAQDWKDGAKADVAAVRQAGHGIKAGYNTVKGAARHQYLQAAAMGTTYGPRLINGVRSAYDNTRLAFDASIGSVADTSAPLVTRGNGGAHAGVWEHARDRGPEYPFYETEPSTSALGNDSAHHDGRVIVRPDGGDNGPADLWSALGPGVVPTPQPLAVFEDEPGMLVDRSTGELFPAAGSPAPPVAEADPAMDPSVLRRVSPQFRDPGRDLLETMRRRHHLDNRGGRGGSVPNDGFDGGDVL